MSKDIVFKNEKDLKRETKQGFPTLGSSYYLAYPEPYIDFKTHIKLLSDDLVQEGDEYRYRDAWVPVDESRCNSFVGHVFIYRRKRKLYV